MSVDESYLVYVQDQLSSLGPTTVRKMFGGAGLYLKGTIFAIIADDALYFKVDDANRPDYEAAGQGPFNPYGGKSTMSSYYEVPIEVLEDDEKIREWADKAVEAAIRAPSTKAKKRQ